MEEVKKNNNMRKLCIKIFIILIPIIAYFTLFLAFDVNDFSGLRHSLFHNIEAVSYTHLTLPTKLEV